MIAPVSPPRQTITPAAAAQPLPAADSAPAAADVVTVRDWLPCPRCEGDGVVQSLLGLRDCGECDGRGEHLTWVDR